MVPNKKLNINLTPSPFCFYILQNYDLKVVYDFRSSDITLQFRIPQYARSGGDVDLTSQVGTVTMLVLLTLGKYKCLYKGNVALSSMKKTSYWVKGY
jgi:hypothetical protein